jgi:single-stranded-DNA-specific exonuclease
LRLWAGEREPRFLISKATFENAKAVGKNGNHLKVSLRQGGAKVDAVAFGQGQVQEAFLDWSFDVVAGRAEPLERDGEAPVQNTAV